MKIVLKIAKIALFVYFVYSTGLFNALSVSQDRTELQRANICSQVIKTETAKISLQNINNSTRQSYATGKNIGRTIFDAELSEARSKVNLKEVCINIFKIYYLNLPSAFILFLFWFYQDRKRIKSPISLIISVVIYPFVLVKVFYKWISIIDNPLSSLDKKYILEAEIRRTKSNFFSVISEDEITIIRDALTKNVSRKEFRSQLSAKGLKAKHSFALALAVTMFLTLLPKTLHASSDKASADIHQVEVSVLVNHTIDNDTGTQTVDAILVHNFDLAITTSFDWVLCFIVPTIVQPIFETDYVPW